MKTVFFDVDTQIDFMFPAGALYVPGAETILGTVAKLNHHAARHRIPVISTDGRAQRRRSRVSRLAASLRGGYDGTAEAGVDAARKARDCAECTLCAI